MSRYTKRDREDDSKVNLTPMLDVVFIMLIFFVVTATFVKEVGLEVNPPEDDTWQPDPRESKIVVRITSRDRILIAQRDVDWRAVRANIERMHAQNPGASVVVQPHPESRTETMVHVMGLGASGRRGQGLAGNRDLTGSNLLSRCNPGCNVFGIAAVRLARRVAAVDVRADSLDPLALVGFQRPPLQGEQCLAHLLRARRPAQHHVHRRMGKGITVTVAR